jgi:hypothetical protein
LQRERISERAIVALSPHLLPVARIDQAHIHEYAVVGAAHAPLEHVRDAELSPDDAQVALCRIAVAHHGCAADDLQLLDARQAREQIVLDAIGEERVFRVAAHVLERQDGDRFILSLGGDADAEIAEPDRVTQARRSKEEQDHGEERTNHRDRDQLPPFSRHGAMMRLDIFRALDAFGRDLERPRQRDRNEKAEGDEADEDLQDPVRRVEGREDDRGDLDDQPARDEIRGADLIDVAPLQLGEEIARAHR